MTYKTISEIKEILKEQWGENCKLAEYKEIDCGNKNIVGFALFYKKASENPNANTAVIDVSIVEYLKSGNAIADNRLKTTRLRCGDDVYEWSLNLGISASSEGWHYLILNKSITVPANQSFIFRLWIALNFDGLGGYWADQVTVETSLSIRVDRESWLLASVTAGATLGVAKDIQFVREVTSALHNLYFVVSGTGERIQIANQSAGNAANAVDRTRSFTWTPPLSLASREINDTTIKGTLRLETYIDSKYEWYNSANFPLTIPSSVHPSVSLAISDGNGYAPIFDNNWLHDRSTFKVIATATESYGSPIQSCVTTISGTTESGETLRRVYYGEDIESDILGIVGTVNIQTTVTDSRGRTGSAAATRTAVKYEPPVITDLSVHRCNQNGTENDQGEYVSFSFSSSVQALNNKNTARYQYRYRSSAETEYTSVELPALANNYSVSNYTVIIPADSTYSYEIVVSVQDKVTITERSTKASTAATIMNFKAEGNGVAFGKVSEEDDTFECAYKTHFIEEVLFEVPPDIPDINIEVDSALSATSEKPVQNKIITAALEGKANSSHTHTESDPTVPAHVKNITQSNINSWNNKSNFSGAYNDLSGKPTIPSIYSYYANQIGSMSSSALSSWSGYMRVMYCGDVKIAFIQLSMTVGSSGVSVSTTKTLATLYSNYRPNMRVELASSVSNGQILIDTSGNIKIWSAVELGNGYVLYATGSYIIA